MPSPEVDACRHLDPFLARLWQSGQSGSIAVIARGVRPPRGVFCVPLPLVHGWAMTLNVTDLPDASRDLGVERLHWDRPVWPGSPQPSAAGRGILQWLPVPGWAVERAGEGVVVAVLDSGVDSRHPDLAGTVVAFVDFVADRAEPYDDHGHGTHVAGLIAGGGVEDFAFRGMAPGARLAAVKVLDRDGEGRESLVIRGLEWCVREKDALGLRVVNLSLGGGADLPWRDDPLCQAAAAAWQSGLVVVTTAGNEGKRGPGTIRSPGISPYVITVGALAADQRTAPFSSRGGEGLAAKPDVVAPGTSVVGPLAAGSQLARLHGHLRVGSAYIAQSGSSVATAAVTGLTALAISTLPHISPDQVKWGLQGAAKDLGEPADRQGRGLVDPEGLRDALEGVLELGARNLSRVDGTIHGQDVLLLKRALAHYFRRDIGFTDEYDRRAAGWVAVYCARLAITAWSDRFRAGLGCEGGSMRLGRRLLEPGVAGRDVMDLQGRLAVAGVFRAVPTGFFDRTTERALAAFQVRSDLAPTGRMGPKTYWRLADRPLGGRPLEGGDVGADVAGLQDALFAGRVCPDGRGRYGRATEEAVRDVQRAAGMVADGRLSLATLPTLGELAPAVWDEEDSALRRENPGQGR